MKSIKLKIITTVVVCAIISATVCGGIGLAYSFTSSYSASEQEMSLTMEKGCEVYDMMLKSIEIAVDVVNGVAVESLKDLDSFRQINIMLEITQNRSDQVF